MDNSEQKTIIPLQFVATKMNNDEYMRKLTTVNFSERNKKLNKLYFRYYKMYVTNFTITLMAIVFVLCVAFILFLFNKVVNDSSVFSTVMLMIYTFFFTLYGMMLISARTNRKMVNNMIKDNRKNGREIFINDGDIVSNGEVASLKCKLNEIKFILRNEDAFIILFNKTNTSIYMERYMYGDKLDEVYTELLPFVSETQIIDFFLIRK